MAKGKRDVDATAFGARVAKRRAALGLSQGELGKLTGMTQQNIGNIEKGLIKRPGPLNELARALGEEVDFLLHGDGESNGEVDEAALRAQIGLKLLVLPKHNLQSILDQAEVYAARGLQAPGVGGGRKG